MTVGITINEINELLMLTHKTVTKTVTTTETLTVTEAKTVKVSDSKGQ